MTLRTLRIGLWSAVVVLALAATVLYFGVGRPGATAFGGGDYVLEDGSGAEVTPAVFTGKPSMLFFGYTHCPDVCPTTLAEMAGWYEQLGPDADKLNAFFVTVDPERDTPAIIDDYVHAVSDRVTGITGSPAEIAKMLAAWKVYSEKVPGADGDYTMNHTASVFLINSKGGFEGTIAYGESQDVAVAKLKKLIAKG
jgi:protein SCO1/2